MSFFKGSAYYKLCFFQMIGFYGLLAGNKARTEVLSSDIAHHLHTVAHLYATSLMTFLQC